MGSQKALGRSLVAGQTSQAELVKLTKGMYWAKYFAEKIWPIRGWGDVVVVDGDLEIEGDLDLWDRKLVSLVVCGSLRVSGLYCETDDPTMGVFVRGDLTAARIDTIGGLCVDGTLTAREVLIGRHNDYSAIVGGDVVTPVFVPEQHLFQIGGTLRADLVLGSLARVKQAKPNKAIVPLAMTEYRARVEPAALEVDDYDENEIYLQHDVIGKLVRAGKPFLRTVKPAAKPGEAPRKPRVRRFTFAEGASNKFWEIQRAGLTVTTRYGRIGAAGQTTVKTLASEAKAEHEHDRLIAEKTRKGYVED